VATVEATAADDLAGASDVVVGAVSVAGSDGVGVVTAFAAVAAAAAAAAAHHHRHLRHSFARHDGAVHDDDAAHCLPRPRHRAAVVVPITFERADYVILQTKSIIIVINIIFLNE